MKDDAYVSLSLPGDAMGVKLLSMIAGLFYSGISYCVDCVKKYPLKCNIFRGHKYVSVDVGVCDFFY